MNQVREIESKQVSELQREVTKAHEILSLINLTIYYEKGHIKDAAYFYNLFGMCDSYEHHTKRAVINRMKRERLIKYFNNVINEVSL